MVAANGSLNQSSGGRGLRVLVYLGRMDVEVA
jgi:hypothetical protein